MGEKIDRYVINTIGHFIYIKDRKEGERICRFETGNKKLNMELARCCLKRIEEK